MRVDDPQKSRRSNSGLRRSMEARTTRRMNPFDRFLQFSGEGHNDKERLVLRIFTPFAEVTPISHPWRTSEIICFLPS